jgi:beta-glucanase (GH16 family)
MMKRLLVFFVMFVGLVVCSYAQEHRRYALVWNDEFNSGTMDETVWSKIKRGKADWAVHMSSADTLYAFENGDLVLRGMVNDFMPNDKAEYLTGGVWTKYRKAFGFGKIEVRAKFDVAMGYWPAIWMLPQVNKGLSWPYGGEIDIMEHFKENFTVNQTVHSEYTVNLHRGNRPVHVAYPNYNKGEYNIYGMERFKDSLVFFVNGKRTFNYPRYRKGNDGQFPFSQHDYFLIIDSQIGRDGSPYIDTDKMPVELRIDYVRYYELDTKTDVIPEPKDFQLSKAKKKKLRKVVYDTSTHFDNPDEYRLVVKNGKVTVSGNRQWAESTLAQLVDDNGRIANMEVHDWATCPYRGISLDKYDKELIFDDLTRLLDGMAFYKLNYLKWNEEGALSVKDVGLLRQHAQDLGITIMTDIPAIPDVDFIDVEGSTQFPASSQVFLRTASKNGGWIYLKGMEEDDLETMMAFSERYWRGGNAGEGTDGNSMPDPLSMAGTRLENFREKVVVRTYLTQ